MATRSYTFKHELEVDYQASSDRAADDIAGHIQLRQHEATRRAAQGVQSVTTGFQVSELTEGKRKPRAIRHHAREARARQLVKQEGMLLLGAFVLGIAIPSGDAAGITIGVIVLGWWLKDTLERALSRSDTSV